MHGVTVITGGASGIGLATARLVHEGGGRVALLDIDFDRCKAAAESFPSGAQAYACNAVDAGSLAAAADSVERDFGPISGLVCCAGAPQVPGLANEMPVDEWDVVVGSHLKGTFLTCREFAGRMAEHGKGGAIVNVASVTAFSPGPTYAYAPAKAAIVNLTTILAGEFGHKGVRVNAVAPGWTDTPFLTRKKKEGQVRDMGALARTTVTGTLLRPEEVAEVIRFLLSPQSGAIVGCTVPCDGGFLALQGWAPYGGNPASKGV